MNFGEDFGQKVDLTASIRGILRNYPEGTAILKELLQNADDAGAKHVCFCLDMREHKTEKAVNQELKQFQGPSLLVYNSAIFSAEDFQSIQRIGDSLKKTAETKTKIGRFGIGFNAIYHLTDLPSFVSASYLVLLDPQARFLPNVNPSNPGKMVNFVDDKSLREYFPDQFSPYEAFDLDWSKPFNGTIFRLPLRTVEQAESSLLSKKSTSILAASELLQALKQEAASMLLFLKNVESIEISEWRSDASNPNAIFKCKISNMVHELRCKRGFIGENSKLPALSSITGSSGVFTPKTADYTLNIECVDGDNTCYSEHWEVCNQLGGDSASAMAMLPANAMMRLVPWGGLAACVTVGKETPKGLAYCFLPLPVQTGLPVMVNGFFELSSNRRDLWQAGGDMSGDGKTRAEWNIELLRSVVAPCYVRLLLRLSASLGFSLTYQQIWPKSSLAAPWTELASSTLMLCKTERLLRTVGRDGKVCEGLSTGPGVGTWVLCKEAVLLPDDCSFKRTGDAHHLALFLKDINQPIVVCVSELRSTLDSRGICRVVAHPIVVRQMLREVFQKGYLPNRVLSVFLLRYCLSDLLGTSPVNNNRSSTSAAATVDCTDLDSLPILPLLDGSTGVMRVFSSKQIDAISSLSSMGFSVTRALGALSQTRFDASSALELLTDVSLAATQSLNAKATASGFLLLCEEAEATLFWAAGSCILDRQQIGAAEFDFLADRTVQTVTNVKRFSASFVPDLLQTIMPFLTSTSLDSKGAVALTSLEPHVSASAKAFLTAFWEYAASRPEVVAAVAGGLPVVPCRDGLLMPLSRISHLLVARTIASNQSTQTDVAESILVSLEKLGAHVLDVALVPSLAASTMPDTYWSYVHDTTRSGLLSLLESLARCGGNAAGAARNTDRFAVLTSADRDDLLAYLTTCESVSSLTETQSHFFASTLPLFTNFGAKDYFTLKKGIPTAGDKEKGALADMSNLIPSLLPNHFVRHDTSRPEELQLLRRLGVKIYSRSSYFKQEFLPNIQRNFQSNAADTTSVLIVMLSELNSLVEEDKMFLEYLKNTAFLPSGVVDYTRLQSDAKSVSLHRPKDLFDPLDSELRAILGSSFFPADVFCREDLVLFLRAVGLKTTLDWPEIVDCAQSIHNDSVDSTRGQTGSVAGQVEGSRDRAQHLCLFIDRNADRLFRVTVGNTSLVGGGSSGGGEKDNKSFAPSAVVNKLFGFRSMFGQQSTEPVSVSSPLPEDRDRCIRQLMGLRWIPTVAAAPHVAMPWPVTQVPTLVTPTQCRPFTDAWQCSASLYLASVTVQSPQFMNALGWSAPIPPLVAAVQLKRLSELHTKLESSETDTADLLTSLLPLLYQRLSASMQDNAQFSQVFETLENVAWVWVGGTFLTPNRLAFSTSVNAQPYLFQVPQELLTHSKLLSVFGVQPNFGANDFISVLRRMADASGSSAVVADDSASIQCSTLSEHQLSLALALATLLGSESSGTAGGVVSLKDREVFLPDSTGRLALSHRLVLDDVPWNAGPVCASVRKSERLAHPNIAAKVADRLGVRSLRALLVSRSASAEADNIFSATDTNISGGAARAEAFGQAESLTNRLRTILDMYPDGSPIFSELIQNADDAGATMVRILLDENSYGTESLLAPAMAPLQGPALLFYNNSTFTESDFRSLARIGQASKLEKLATTGRFGLGFNSVYHLTDTPTFVSRDSLVFFDPHTAFVPGATPSQPGLRIRLQSANNSSLAAEFPNQCQPYSFFGCDFSQSFPGTLFRFPLRSDALAKKSEVSRRAYAVSDVRALLTQLRSQLPVLPLFLRCVRSVEVYRCEAGSATPLLLHRATATNTLLETRFDQTLLKYFDKPLATATLSEATTVATNREDFYALLASTSDETLPTRISSVEISVADGQLGGDREKWAYKIATGLRGGWAKKMACHANTRHLKLVPMGSVAACTGHWSVRSVAAEPADSYSVSVDAVSTETELPTAIKGQAFCFLPLPVQTDLPVHVNAYFELSSNRRDIWRGEDAQGEARARGEWNDVVMKFVLAPLYGDLLESQAAEALSAFTSRHGSNAVVPYKDENGSLVGPYAVHDLFPCPPPAGTWGAVSSSFFSLMPLRKLLWSSLRGGGYFPTAELLLLEAVDGKVTANDDRQMLETLLLREGICVAVASPVILKTLVDAGCVKGAVSPVLIRKLFFCAHEQDQVTHPCLQLAEASTPDLDAATYLLRYCASDMPPSPVTDLIGLPLLPLESGRLGRIGDCTDPPLYLVSDVERTLLLGSASWCIVSDDVRLGSNVSTLLKCQTMSSACNVRPLSPLDLLKLLSKSLPSEWVAASTWVVDRSSAPAGLDEAWLRELWAYVIQKQMRDLFGAVIPTLPVRTPVGSFLVKIAPQVPVLHMSHTDIPPVAAEALACLGVYIYDASVLGSLSYSQEITALLSEPTPLGLLKAVLSCQILTQLRPGTSGKVAVNSNLWDTMNTALKEGLRNFLLDYVISKLPFDSSAPEMAKEEDLQLLRLIPVWKRYGAGNEAAFGTLFIHKKEERLRVPPSDADPTLLGQEFVYLRSDVDRRLYAAIGLTEVSKALYTLDFLVPMIEDGRLQSRAGEISLQILRTLPLLEIEKPGIGELLSKKTFLQSADGKLSAARALFDPTITHLTTLLPKNSFPNSELYKDVMHSLRSLGLNSTLTCLGVLRAAISLDKDASALVWADGSDAVKAAVVALQRRGTGLMRHLDLHGEELLRDSIRPEVTAEILDVMASSSGLGESKLLLLRAACSDGIDGDESKCAFGLALQMLSWTPVLMASPASTSATDGIDVNSYGLPWPSALHTALPVTSPEECRPLSDVWLCSASCKVSPLEPQSTTVRSLLGWSRRLSGKTVALQLLGIQERFASATPSAQSSLVQHLCQLMPRMLALLSEALDVETPDQVASWKTLLQGNAVVWTGESFIEPARLSFEQLEGINAEPQLYCARGDLKAHRRLLLVIGAKPKFEPVDMINMLAELQQKYRNSTLPPSVLELCIGILRILIRMQDPNSAVPSTDESADRLEGAGEGLAEMKGDTGSEKAGIDVVTAQTINLSPYWPIFVPDSTGVFAPSTSLSFDDAPWLSASPIALQQRGSGALRFIHRGLDSVAAFALGARSLREQLFSGDSIMCPEPKLLRASLSGCTITDALSSLVSIADSLGARGLHLVYDGRRHPVESLMHPGLADAQGAALVVYLEGIRLGAEGLVQALSCPFVLPSLPDDSMSQKQTMFSGSLSRGVGSRDGYPGCGKRLAAAFVLTDCLQVISGKDFYIFDPCGSHLFTGPDEKSPSSESGASNSNGSDAGDKRVPKTSRPSYPPKGQRCAVVGTSSGDLLTRFPDQFAPVLCMPLATDSIGQCLAQQGEIPGILLRLPLRTKASNVSDAIVTEEAVRLALRCFKGQLEGALLFGQGALRYGTLRHWLEGMDEPTLDLELNLLDAPSVRINRRRVLFEDSTWKRTGVMSLISGHVPVEGRQESKIEVHMDTAPRQDSGGGFGWLDLSASCLPQTVTLDTAGAQVVGCDEWLVLSVVGAANSRSLALTEPFKSLRLPPMVSVAARFPVHTTTSKLDSPPVSGLVFCGAGSMGAIGLPFHVEGAYVQDMSTAGLALPLAPSEYRAAVATPPRPPPSLDPCRTGVEAVHLPVSGQAITQWNAALLVDAFEVLVPKLLLEAREFLSSRSLLDKLQLYRLWPFLPRMTPRAAHAMRTSKLLPQLASKPLYLRGPDLGPMSDCIISPTPIPSLVSRYLENGVLPLASVPTQISRDLLSHPQGTSLGVQQLTPAVLRNVLRKNAGIHCSRLRERYELVEPMLRFCLTDAPRFGDAREVRRRYFRELQGVPLLYTADGFVRPFPSHSRDKVAVCSPVLGALLSQLQASLLHPWAKKSFPGLLRDDDLRETLSVDFFSANFLQERASLIFPPHIRGVQAVSWGGSAAVESEQQPQPITAASAIVPVDLPSALLIFTLWKEVFAIPSLLTGPAADDDEGRAARISAKQQQESQMALLADWPLLPVLSRDKKLLISPVLLSAVIWDDSTTGSTFLEQSLAQLGRDLGTEVTPSADRTGSESRDSLSGHRDPELWAWASSLAPECLPISQLPSQASGTNHEVKGPGAIPVVTAVEVPATRPEPAVSSSQLPVTLNADTIQLKSICLRLGVPRLDLDFFKQCPTPFPVPVFRGNRLLQVLCRLNQDAASSPGSDVESMLDFHALSIADRTTLLLEIARDTSQSVTSDNARLASLKLFTTREGHATTADHPAGTFWCASNDIMEVSGRPIQMSRLSDIDETNSEGNRPVILLNDPTLVSTVYPLVGVTELTYLEAAKRFFLPELLDPHRSPHERLACFGQLRRRWSTCRGDRELIDALKVLPFVPVWREPDSQGLDAEPLQYSRADELFSWKNETLVTVLRGTPMSRACCRYFAPLVMRDEDWHVLLTDLGMAPELDKAGILRLATDIEAIVTQSKDLSEEERMAEATTRGRTLLKYLKGEASQLFGSLLDPALARTLSRVKFVPVHVPVTMEAGGVLVTRYELTSFDQVLSQGAGVLGFTVMPVLEKDVSPPQIYFSSLGISSSPSLEILLRHFKNLIESAPLDRWNCEEKYPVMHTFASVFTALQEKWKDVSPAVKTALRDLAILPIGHSLVKPGRLFFRLSEDLSPFMHEIPRCFGPHETFLKQIGVKESPSRADYLQFLTELKAEAGEHALNPNELRAVLAIVQLAMAPRHTEAPDPSHVSQTASEERLYVPDEHSVLRLSLLCLVDDDDWLRERAEQRIAEMGFYFLHSALATSLSTNVLSGSREALAGTDSMGSLLRIPRLSDIVVEVLARESVSEDGVDDDYTVTYEADASMLQRRFVCPIFNEALKSLLSLSSANSDRLKAQMTHVSLRFVGSLYTRLDIRDPRTGLLTSSDKRLTVSFATSSDVSNQWTFFINVNMIRTPLTIALATARCVCTMADVSVHLAPAVALLIDSSAADIGTVLGSLRIGYIEASSTEKDSKTKSSRLRSCARGVPGAAVLPEDEAVLELKPFRTFRQGEVVAVDMGGSDSESGTGLIYGIVVALDDNSSTSTSTAHTPLRRLLISVGAARPVARLVTDVYSFRSIRDLVTTSGSNAEELESIRAQVSRLRDCDTLRAHELGTSTSADQTTFAAGAGIGSPIGVSDVVTALNGLLLRAGIPQDLQRQTLCTSILELREQLERTERELVEQRDEAATLRESVSATSAALKCEICVSADRSHVMVPCGHTLCAVCLNSLSRNSCPFCRKAISQRIRYYTPGMAEDHS